MDYLENLEDYKKEYFKVLEPDFPEWLIEYINTPSLLKQQYISVTCGTIYSDLYPETNIFFSSLDHSVAVALVCWHYTHDKKATLAGLFHDIATPTFKHCVDFMNGDYVNQESTEELTRTIIESDKKIMELLNRDNITVDEVYDYKLYPIADNDTPKLSADRFEYSLSNMLFTYRLVGIDKVKELYNDVTFDFINEEGIRELGFNSIECARDFVEKTSRLSIIYRSDRTIYSMQLYADILKRMQEDGLITVDDLYNMKEEEVRDLIHNSQYGNIYSIWENAKVVKTSNTKPEGVFSVNHPSKIRYINPLVRTHLETGRAYKIDPYSHAYIDVNLSYSTDRYVYLDGINFNKLDKPKTLRKEK